jgi:hypothetical protein
MNWLANSKRKQMEQFNRTSFIIKDIRAIREN